MKTISRIKMNARIRKLAFEEGRKYGYSEGLRAATDAEEITIDKLLDTMHLILNRRE